MLAANSLPAEVGETHYARVRSYQHLSRRAFAHALLPLILAFLTISACGVTSGTGAQSATQKCGTVSMLIDQALTAKATPSNAESCFSHAFAQCIPATLVYTQHSVDTGVTRTFTIHTSGTSCTIHETVHPYVIPKTGKSQPDKTYTCSGLKQKPGSFVVTSCGGDGDVLIPAA